MHFEMIIALAIIAFIILCQKYHNFTPTSSSVQSSSSPLSLSLPLSLAQRVPLLSKKDGTNLYQLFYDVASVLDREDIPYLCDSGTLLGAIRHKGLIPWDDDIDINIHHKYYNKLKQLTKTFDAMGYTLIDHYFGFKIYLTSGDVIKTKKEIKPYKFPFLDIFLTRDDGSYYSKQARINWGNCSGSVKQNNPPRKAMFGNFEVNVPNKSEEILAKCYGANWKTNVPFTFNHKNYTRDTNAFDLTPSYYKPDPNFVNIRGT